MTYLFSGGNWRKSYGSDGVAVYSGIDKVATIYGTNNYDDFYSALTREANADLIEKAPDMYRLLERTSIAISRNDQDTLQLIEDNIHKLFQEMGVDYTQRRYRELQLLFDQDWMTSTMEKANAEYQKNEESTTLHKYFGDDWDKYDLYPADVGYHVLSKEEVDEEYFIFGTVEGCVKPFYYNSKYFNKHDDSPAYVLPYRTTQPMLHYEKAYAYYYSDIKEAFQNAGITNPDMDIIEGMLNGRTLRKLILDYKKEYK